MSPPVLCYWDIRGLAQPIRMLLAYTETEFEDKQLSCGPAPDYDKSCWFDQKFSLGLDFPNLPYFIDGDIKLTQTNAIMRYIGRKHDLCGKTEEERARVDMLAEQSMDLRNGWVRLCYSGSVYASGVDYESAKKAYLEGLPKTLQQFEAFLGGRQWFAGSSLAFPDFHMYELLDQHKLMVPNCLADCPNLTAFMERFESLPQIAKYKKSPKFMSSPINNKMASFGGEK